MPEIKLGGVRTDIIGIISDPHIEGFKVAATSRLPQELVGGEIWNLRTIGGSWDVRVNCNMDPASCPLLKFEVLCKAGNFISKNGVVGSRFYGNVYCGKAPSNLKDITACGIPPEI